MTYEFKPNRPTTIKEEIYSYLSTVPLAVEFLEWCQYSKINSKDEGLIAFDPNCWFNSQWRAVETIFRALGEDIHWIVFLKGRQQGITTVLDQFDLWYHFKYKNLQGSIVTADYKISDEIRAQLRTIYSNLPGKAKITKINDNSQFMSFKNNSKLKFFFTTGKTSKKGNMGRSGASNYVHGTEMAYIQSVEDWNAFTSVMSKDYIHRLYIFESTANMYNFFYDMWETAKDSPTQVAQFLGWWMKETYIITDQRDYDKYSYPLTQWENEQVSLVKELYNFEISMAQMAWWRKMAKEEMSDRGMLTKEDVALQEHPFTEHDAFRLSGQSFFHQRTLQTYEEKKVSTVRRLAVWVTNKPEETEFKEASSGKIKIWEEYEPQGKYLVAGDPTFGANPDSDNGVITVYKLFKDRCVQVLEYADNLIDTFHFTWILLSISGMYHAPQIIEVNGPGRTVLGLIDMYKRWVLDTNNKVNDKMTVYEYARQLKEYMYHRPDSLGTGYCRHWLTTGQTKEPLMFQFQSCFHNGEVIVRSPELIKEMEFVTKDGDQIQAIDGKKDDRVIASALAVEFWMRFFRTNMPTFSEYDEKKKELLEQKNIYKAPEKAFMQDFVRGIIAGRR